jgi:hypothetical protein
VWQKFIFVNNSDNIEMAFMKKFRTQWYPVKPAAFRFKIFHLPVRFQRI